VTYQEIRHLRVLSVLPPPHPETALNAQTPVLPRRWDRAEGGWQVESGQQKRRASAGLLVALALALVAPALSPSPARSDAGLPPATDIAVQGDPVIAAAGDIACDPDVESASQCHSKGTSEVIEAMDPNAVLALGDLQYMTGAYSDFLRGYDPNWGAFKSITYPVIGDNEYLSSPGADGYFDYWNGPGNNSGRAGERGKGYYSFDIGTWHVVALNSEISRSRSSSQGQWLKADLAAHPNTCTLAYWHEPRFSSDRGHQTPSMGDLYTILYNGGADVLLTGHLHSYERFAPQDPDANPDPNGIRQFTVGTGGKNVVENTGTAPNSEVSGDEFGVLKMTLRPGSYEWEFEPSRGSFSDSGSTPCSRGTGTRLPSSTTVSSVTPNQAKRGATQQVTLTGANFATPATVDFGADVAVQNTKVASSTSITATVTVSPDATPGPRTVTVTSPGRTPVSCPACFLVEGSIQTGSASLTPPLAGVGYRLVAADGGIFSYGSATFKGSTGAIKLAQPIMSMASTPSGNGYWLVASDGGIFAFGDARFYGSTGAIKLNQPIVAMAATGSGNGYWLVASDGGIFAFGDARFYGSTGAVKLTRPIVGIAPTPSANGYWLVASDGGIFAFGDARFKGSTGAIKLAKPIVAMAPTPSGNGYWMTASDGGIFAFGDARFLGSTGALRLTQPIVTMAPTPSGNGYWLVASDGGIFAFGDAPFLGSTGAIRLVRPIVGMAAR
jgi:hypothetical protein